MDRLSTFDGSRCVQDPADSSARPATTVEQTTSSTPAGLQTIPELDDVSNTNESSHVVVHDSPPKVASGQTGPDIGLSSVATKPESQSFDLLHGEIDPGSSKANEDTSPIQTHGQSNVGLFPIDPIPSQDISLDLLACGAKIIEPLALRQLPEHSNSVASYVTARTSSVASYHTAPSLSRRTQQSFTRPGHVPRTGYDHTQSHDSYLGGSAGATLPFTALPETSVERLAASLVLMYSDKDTVSWRHIDRLVAFIDRRTKNPSDLSREDVDELMAGVFDLLVPYEDPTNPDFSRTCRNKITRSVLDYIIAIQECVRTFNTTPAFSSQWMKLLHYRGIILDPADELDWSGRGQHVEYMPADEKDIPLRTERVLGHSSTALVESVRCRRIRLARKKIRCIQKLKKEDFIGEVELLQRLRHAHVLRVVGTYTLKKDLAILLYPATPWNLESFMDDMLDSTKDFNPDINEDFDIELFDLITAKVGALRKFFACLAHALDAIHASNVKHMDLKPQNLLVSPHHGYKIYIADFGIARAYKSAADAETSSVTAFTPRYAAPEVVSQETRGLSADVFSLGCIYLEMLATLKSCDILSRNRRNGRHELAQVSGLGSNSPGYSTHIEAVTTWCKASVGNDSTDTIRLFLPRSLPQIIPHMLDRAPERRPTASELTGLDGLKGCGFCDAGPEPFKVADDDFE